MALGVPEGTRQDFAREYGGDPCDLTDYYPEGFNACPSNRPGGLSDGSAKFFYARALQHCTRADIHAFARELVAEVA